MLASSGDNLGCHIVTDRGETEAGEQVSDRGVEATGWPSCSFDKPTTFCHELVGVDLVVTSPIVTSISPSSGSNVIACMKSSIPLGGSVQERTSRRTQVTECPAGVRAKGHVPECGCSDCGSVPGVGGEPIATRGVSGMSQRFRQTPR